MTYQLNVALNGVCMHLQNGNDVSLPATQRVVFPAGSGEFDGVTIDAHSPVYQITMDGTGLPPQPLANATVTFVAAGATQSDFTGTLNCVPHLRTFFPWFELDLPKVTTGSGLSGGVFVDFDLGSVSSANVDGAACTQIAIGSEFPAAAMVITPWNGDPAQIIPLSLPATVTIENDSTNHDLQDFGLNFLLAQPVDVPISQLIDEVNSVINAVRACLAQQEGDAGCSNSQYP